MTVLMTMLMSVSARVFEVISLAVPNWFLMPATGAETVCLGGAKMVFVVGPSHRNRMFGGANVGFNVNERETVAETVCSAVEKWNFMSAKVVQPACLGVQE
jgi:hypothetical protein